MFSSPLISPYSHQRSIRSPQGRHLRKSKEPCSRSSSFFTLSVHADESSYRRKDAGHPRCLQEEDNGTCFPQVGIGVPGLLGASEPCSQCPMRIKDERNGLTSWISSLGVAAVSPVHCWSAWDGEWPCSPGGRESLPLSVLNKLGNSRSRHKETKRRRKAKMRWSWGSR